MGSGAWPPVSNPPRDGAVGDPGRLECPGTLRGWCNRQHNRFWPCHWGFESSPPSCNSSKKPQVSGLGLTFGGPSKRPCGHRMVTSSGRTDNRPACLSIRTARSNGRHPQPEVPKMRAATFSVSGASSRSFACWAFHERSIVSVAMSSSTTRARSVLVRGTIRASRPFPDSLVSGITDWRIAAVRRSQSRSDQRSPSASPRRQPVRARNAKADV